MANYRYCVYKHTNKANGKSYIGRTHLNPLHRWRVDGSGYDTSNEFGKAIKEFGWDNFSHEILVYGIKGKKQADELEIAFIKQFNTIAPNGYNTEDGGINGSVNRKPYKEKRPKSGWHHSEETKQKIKEGILKSDTHPLHQRINHSKPVDMFTLEGEYIRTFVGASEAEKETGISIDSISKCCNNPNRFKSAGGYKWQFSKSL